MSSDNLPATVAMHANEPHLAAAHRNGEHLMVSPGCLLCDYQRQVRLRLERAAEAFEAIERSLQARIGTEGAEIAARDEAQALRELLALLNARA